MTTDVGLSPPYNSLFTFFGQFFDHGVDQTVKSGGTVFVPLRADDPLRTLGPDGIAGNGDEVPASQAFMVLTRAQNQPGADGILGTADDIQNANNTDTPWVDQSQTYTSHSSHQFFLREYNLVAGQACCNRQAARRSSRRSNDADGPATTGSISTWAATKAQAASKLGMLLVDKDVLNIPMIAADPYGNFIPDPTTGMPALRHDKWPRLGQPGITGSGACQRAALRHPVRRRHRSQRGPGHRTRRPALFPTPDSDSAIQTNFALQPPGTYDDELLNTHFTCGDGRCNENIALTTIHQIFHHEHDRLVDYNNNVIQGDPTLKADYEATNCSQRLRDQRSDTSPSRSPTASACSRRPAS